MVKPFGHITVNRNVIYPRYDPARFVGREWLIDRITQFRDGSDDRHLIIVGEPGSGKSTFVAYLAETWNCPRHFIRADNLYGVTGVDPRAFLLSVGAQLYQKFGREIFKRLESINTRVTVGLTKDQAKVVGVLIDEMYTLPFLPQPEINIQLDVGTVAGQSQVVGKHVKRMIDVTHALDELTLLHVTMLQPLKGVQELYPDERVVLFIDALDESLEHPGRRILDIIPTTTDPDFPDNLRLVMTSRPGNHLARFKREDLLRLDDTEAGYWEEARKDTREYIQKRLSEEPLTGEMEAMSPEKLDAFIEEIETKSDGNFLYLYYFMNAVTEKLKTGTTELGEITVPADLDEIYRFFALERIRKNPLDMIHFLVDGSIPDDMRMQLQAIDGVKEVNVIGKEVTVITQDIDPVLLRLFDLANSLLLKISNLQTQRGTQFGTWEEKYLPVLGILAVAFGGLSRGQLAGFAQVEVEYVDSILAQLLQFLDTTNINSSISFRLYHRDFAEYLLDHSRNRDYPLNRKLYHDRIADFYRDENSTWFEVNWGELMDEYASNYLVAHLVSAGRMEDLFSLIDRHWMKFKYACSLSYRAFARDVELAIHYALQDQTAEGWFQLARLCLIYTHLGHISAQVPPELLCALAQIGQEERALGYANLIPEPDRRIEVYLLLGQTLEKTGKYDLATDVLKQALTLVKVSRDGFNRVKNLHSLADLLARLGDSDSINQVLVEVVSISDEYKYFRKDAISSIALSMAASGDFDRAMAAARTVASDQTEILSNITSHLVEEGNYHQALKAAINIKDELERDRTLASLAYYIGGEWDWEQVLETIHQIKGEYYKEIGLSQAIIGLAKAGKFDEALAAIQIINYDYQKSATQAEISKILSGKGFFERAYATIQEIKQETSKLYALTDLVRDLVTAGRSSQARLVVEKELLLDQVTKNPSLGADVISNIALVKLAVGDSEQVFLTVEGIASENLRARTFTNIAQALAKNEQIEIAKIAADKSLDAARKIQDLDIRNIILKNDVIPTLIASENLDSALTVTNSIEDINIKKQAISEVAKSIASVNNLDIALNYVNDLVGEDNQPQVLGDMSLKLAEEGNFFGALAAAQAISDEYYKVMTLNNITQAILASGERDVLAHVLSAAHDIELGAWKAVALSSIAVAFDSIHENEQAREILDQALLAVQVSPQSFIKTPYLKKIILALVTVGNYERAVELTRTMEDFDRYEALGDIAQTLAIQGDYENVNAIVKEIGDEYHRNWKLHDVGLAFAKAGFFNQSMAAVQTITTTYIKDMTLGETAEIFARLWKIEQAIIAARAIGNPFKRDSTLSTIAEGFVKAENLDQFIESVIRIEDEHDRVKILSEMAQVSAEGGAFNKALGIAQVIDDEYKRSQVLTSIIEVLTNTADSDQVHQMITKIADEQDETQVLGNIAKSLSSRGFHDLALALVSKISDEMAKVDSLVSIVKALAAAGNLGEALEIARSIVMNSGKAVALFIVTQAMVAANEIEKARDISAETLITANKVENDYWKALALTKASQALSLAGEIGIAQTTAIQALEAAQALLDMSERENALYNVVPPLAFLGNYELVMTAIREIGDESQRRWALADGVRAFTNGGFLDQALKAVQEIEDKESKSRMLYEIADDLTKAGKMDRALTILKWMEDEDDRAQALFAVAHNLAEAGNFTEALKVVEATGVKYYRLEGLPILADVLVGAGDTKGFARILKQAKKSGDVSGMSMALSETGKILAEQGKIEEALAAARAIEEEKAHAEALSRIAKILAAQNSLEQVFRIVQEIEIDYIRSETWAGLAQVLAEKGIFEETLMVVQAVGSEEAQKVFLHSFAKACAGAGKLDQAIAAAQAIKDMSTSSEALSNVAQSAITLDDFDHALRAILAIPYDFIKAPALSSLALSVAGTKVSERVENVLEAARLNVDEQFRAEVMAAISVKLAVLNQPELAAKILREAFDIARQYEIAGVYQTLANGAPLIAEFDMGLTLMRIWQAFLEWNEVSPF